MGYRSQVRCLIYGPKEKIEAYIVQTALMSDSTVFKSLNHGGFKETLRMYETEYFRQKFQILDLYGDDWKWYGAYEDVQAWEKFMYEAEENDLHYEFVRIGEDAVDIEIKRSEKHFNFLSVHTAVDVNIHIGDEVSSTFIGPE